MIQHHNTLSHVTQLLILKKLRPLEKYAVSINLESSLTECHSRYVILCY